MSPKVAIIIVNWNGKADTLECLFSLGEDTYQNKQIIVVDNGSTDDSVSVIRAAYPVVTVLETGANLGFTGGNNVGIDYALKQGADYVFLLNNDTTVEPDALIALVEAAEVDLSYGLLTPVIHYFDTPAEAWFAGSQMNLARGVAFQDNHNIPERNQPPHAIPWACGCAMLVRSEVIKRVGGFDDRYFLNWEDADLSVRIRAQGHILGIVPQARIYHKVGRSFQRSGTGQYYYVRNNLLLVSLHSRKVLHASLYIIIERLRESLRAIKNRQPASARMLFYTLRAIQDHFLHRYGQLQ